MSSGYQSLDKQLCFAVYETASEFTKLYTSVLQPFGLTYTQYTVLLALWEQDGVPMKELGAKLNLGTGTLTPMVNRMQEKGWLRKERSAEDERKVIIHLEEKAERKKDTILQRVEEEIRLCHISLPEYEEIMAGLKNLYTKLTARSN